VLQGVSVTARTTSTVTIEALEATPCPPGYYCGATLTQQRLTISWKGKSRPAVPSVINLFGTTTNGSLSPVGYTKNTTSCFIDYC
jgi:hypothetical protein